MSEYLLKLKKLGVYYQSGGFDDVGTTSSPYTSPAGLIGTVDADPKTSISQLEFTGGVTKLESSSRTFITGKGVLPTIKYTFYATANDLIPVLTGAYQERAYTDQTTTHKFIFKPKDEDIDFQSEGYLFTIAAKNSNTDGVLLYNAIVNSLTLTIPNTGEGEARLAKCEVEWVGNRMVMGQNITTFSTPSLTEQLNYTGTNDPISAEFITPSISSVCWRNYVLNFNNNVTANCYSGGYVSNYNIDPKITHTLDIPYNDTTLRFWKDYQDGTILGFALGNTYTTTDAKHFNFYARACYLNANPLKAENMKEALSLQMNETEYSSGWGGLTLVTATNWGI